jgi:hypothetical protein
MKILLSSILLVGLSGCAQVPKVPDEPAVVIYPQDAEQCGEHPEYPWCQAR